MHPPSDSSLQKFREEKLREYQQGFRREISTIDAIHIITQTIKKYYEDIKLHMLFVDFKQTFDCIVKRNLTKKM